MRKFVNITFVLLVAILLAGCDVNDYFKETCYRAYLLQVSVSADANDDFHPEKFAPGDMPLMSKATDALVWIFTEDTTFLGTVRSKIDQIVELPYSDQPKIFTVAVAVGEGVDPEAIFPKLVPGQKYSVTDLLYALKHKEISADYADSPTDFMYASSSFVRNPNEDRNVLCHLFVQPRIGAVKIRTIGLADWANKVYGNSGQPIDVFDITFGTTLDKYNFAGLLYGTKVTYWPVTGPAGANVLETPTFAMMPTPAGANAKVYIYRNKIQIYPNTPAHDTFSYRVDPRAPYIIILDFTGKGPSLDVIPSEFTNIYIHAEF